MSANCTVGIDPVLQCNGQPEKRLLCWGSDSPAGWVGALPLLALVSSVTTDVMKVLDKTETLQTLCLLVVQRMSQRFRRRWVCVSGRLQVMFPSGSRPARCNTHVSLRGTYKDFLSTVILWARTLCLQGSYFYLSVYNLVDNNLTRAGMNVPFIRGERLYLFKEQKAWTKTIHLIPIAWS